jgi:hypothetical protein
VSQFSRAIEGSVIWSRAFQGILPLSDGLLKQYKSLILYHQSTLSRNYMKVLKHKNAIFKLF